MMMKAAVDREHDNNSARISRWLVVDVCPFIILAGACCTNYSYDRIMGGKRFGPKLALIVTN